MYLRNRYYSAATGRFLTEDPIRSGLNWYVYCGNNPVILIDPLGLFDEYTRLSYSQTYNEDVKVLQNELAWLGYLDMSDGGWGFFGKKTQAAVNAYKTDMGLGNTGKDRGVVGVQTWASLGLTYLTRDDIYAGVKIVTIDRKQYKDVTIPINDALANDVDSFKANQWDFGWFYEQVAPKCVWDIKDHDSWETTIGSTYPGEVYTTVIFSGAFTTPEALGNMTYGFLGTAAGFPESILLMGGDAATDGFNITIKGMMKGAWGIIRSADSEEDKANIRAGIELYGKWHIP